MNVPIARIIMSCRLPELVRFAACRPGRTVGALLLTCAMIVSGGCGGRPWHTKSVRGLVPALSFTLTDDHGHTVHGDSYAGKVVLLYFGFSNCKLACPETLGKLATVLHVIGPQARNVKVLFVSVDPRRDTPLKLETYTRSFAPEMVGLTGTQDQLQRVARRYRVAYSYGKGYPHGSYAVYHSSAVFVFDRRGRARLLVQGSDSVQAVAADLKRLLEAS